MFTREYRWKFIPLFLDCSWISVFLYVINIYITTNTTIKEDLTELIAHKTVKNIVKKEEYERFRLGKYIEIQLAEDVLSPQHPLILPSDITPQMVDKSGG